MRVFGIDPGSTVTAFGVVETARGRLLHIGSGHFRTYSEEKMQVRLLEIFRGLQGALREFKPEVVAIEAIFRHKSSESALRLGQARGVALLAVAELEIPLYEYNTKTVKMTVGAHGDADKEGVAKMVNMLLGTALSSPYDVTDALAIAITHCLYSRSPASLAAERSR